jgi:hypothetical protein
LRSASERKLALVMGRPVNRKKIYEFAGPFRYNQAMQITRRDLLWLFFTILLVLIIYFPALHFNLTYLDDNVWILDYHWYLKNISNWPSFFTQQDLVTGFFYRPILNLSFMFNAVLSGQNLAAYRMFNLGLHIINIFLVYMILRKFSEDRLKISFPTLIFAIHPTLVSSIVWIPGRTDSLLGLFVFLSFINFLKFMEQKKWQFLVCHLILLFLGLLTKETAVALVLLCGFYGWMKKDKQFPWIIVLGWGIVFVVWLVMRMHALKHAPAVDLNIALPSFIENLPGIISYFGKVFLPINLSVVPNLKDISLWPGILSMAIVASWIKISRVRNNRIIVFGLCWFVLFLLPSLVYSFILHEYRLYVPILGLLILMTQCDWPKNKYVIGICIGSITILFFFCCILQARNFKDKFSYWKNAVKTSPHLPLAHRNLGAMYHLDNKLDLAKPCYEEALRLNPNEFMAHNNLGLIAMDQGNNALAEQEFQSEIRINPTYDNVYFNLGVLYARQGRLTEAKKAWQKTIELNPKYLSAYQPLIELYLREGDSSSANKYSTQLKSLGFN